MIKAIRGHIHYNYIDQENDLFWEQVKLITEDQRIVG